MKDKFGRQIKHLRLSITPKCSYKCIYCDKEGLGSNINELSLEEITELCKVMAQILKVKRIKITGGEPLCRKDLIQIIENIKKLDLYDDISLTTNGYSLEENVVALHEAGLNRLNVSLCSLNPVTYEKITGCNALQKVLRGLQKAKETGLLPIKLNFVVLKDLNASELEDMLDFCGKNEYILQLIELHEVPNDGVFNKKCYEKYHVDVKPIIENLENRAIKTIVRDSMQNRKVFTLPNNAIVETIVPSHDFCMGCTKLRIGCDGNLFGCLFRADLGRNLKSAISNHYSLSKYEEIIEKVLDSREPYY